MSFRNHNTIVFYHYKVCYQDTKFTQSNLIHFLTKFLLDLTFQSLSQKNQKYGNFLATFYRLFEHTTLGKRNHT